VKFIEPLGQTGRRRKFYQFTAIDDCTRLRVLRAYPRCDQKTAIAFVDDVMAKLPFQVERVQTDIQSGWRGIRAKSSAGGEDRCRPAPARHRYLTDWSA
jgi:hypothetical protein